VAEFWNPTGVCLARALGEKPLRCPSSSAGQRSRYGLASRPAQLAHGRQARKVLRSGRLQRRSEPLQRLGHRFLVALGAVLRPCDQRRYPRHESAPVIFPQLRHQASAVGERELVGPSGHLAAELVISPSTVHTHTVHIYAKCGVSTRAGLAMFAMRHGLAARTGPGVGAKID
jgi:hypothetical protein